MKKIVAISLWACFVLTSCNDSGFNEGASGQGDAAPVEGGGDVVQEECVDGDRINLNFPPEIQQCVEQEKIFDFNTNTCVDVTKATFDCSFDAMAQSVANIGVPNTSIAQAKEGGALLISCSEKNEGKTIIAQWYYRGSTNSCDFNDTDATKVVTACYKLYLEGEAPPAETPEQRAAAVQACLTE